MVENMMDQRFRDDLDRAMRRLRAAAATVYALGGDEDNIYDVVEAGINDQRHSHIAEMMQNMNKGEYRTDGADTYASQPAA
jgi:hypothetical protein